jgi:hypothetical protein
MTGTAINAVPVVFFRAEPSAPGFSRKPVRRNFRKPNVDIFLAGD